MQLFHKEYPGPGKPLIVMHGLFGMLDNWHNIARKLSEKYHVFLLDLRNHGQSPHADTINYPIMADDLFEFMQDQGLANAAILGHSMGGKVAMEFALKFPEKVSKLIVVDIAPVRYKPGHNEIFDALFKLDIKDQNKKRSDLDKELSVGIPEFGVRQFLMKSLDRKEEGGYNWKFNLQALYDHYDEILAEIETGRTYSDQTLFIRGGNSPYVQDQFLSQIEAHFPNYELETIAGSGHWVHAEKPDELLKSVNGFLHG